MRKKIGYSYFFLFCSLLALVSLPRESTEHIRGSAVAFMAPSWKQILAAKSMVASVSQSEKGRTLEIETGELNKLRLENALLRTEITHLKEVLQHEIQLISHLKAAEGSFNVETVDLVNKRHKIETERLFQLQLQSIPARIIVRSPESWNSSMWIDVGNATNEKLGKIVVAKNSPVVVGNSVVGIIDYVGRKQARVQLITDSELTPSVRAMRDQSFLAKGEIHGAGKPLWRTQRYLLTGIGFNYDFADEEGPARDLRNGKPLDGSGLPAKAILKNGDLLVTTGMDGVFPPHLLVAKVTKVHPLKEGDYYYELEALPTAGNFDELTDVFVLPPISQE